ncbi:hypothetical protein ABZ319_06970 [Nocardia sp. NPDC005978]|uniref:hypothetical protein n=1 Tax=Nocardia sp. NPDC005978 TaxID=3156725 RepID=UPI0033A9B416
MSRVVEQTFVVGIDSATARAGDRDTIGGWPVLDAGQPVPECDCGATMALYFQLEVPAEVPYFGGDQLLVFQCPVDSDASLDPEPQLPERYWDTPTGNQPRFWRILLQRAGTVAATRDPHFAPRRLSLRPVVDREPDPRYSGPLQGFKVGGTPYWVQDAPEVRCACGSDMTFLCQVTEDFPFRKYLDPDRDGTVDCDGVEDGLLLGNQVYILACPAHCDPAAVVPICQN